MIWPDLVKRCSWGLSRRARPKSTITGSRRPPVFLIMTLAGFRSRWMTFCVCASCKANGELAHQRRGLALWPALVADQCRQRLALDVGHRQVRLSLDFPGVIHAAKVGMAKRGGGARLFQEPSPRLGSLVLSEVGYLQGHRAFEMGILGEVNRAHPALPQPLDDPVPAELFEIGESRTECGHINTPGQAEGGPVLVSGAVRSIDTTVFLEAETGTKLESITSASRFPAS